MKRRNFLAGLGPLAAAPVASFTNIHTTAEHEGQYLEWIKYALPPGTNKKRTENYYQEAAIPALNKLGIKNIGVFNVMHGPNEPSLYVLIPHDNLDSLMTYQQKLLDDKTYGKAAEDFLESSISNPAYTRLEKGLMKAFKGMPRVEPAINTIGEQRIFEWRIYESHNYMKAQKKIDMFNEAGEIQIFRDTGLTPVFFGETLFGDLMPNLQYLLVFKDMNERNKSWETFIKSPQWAAIKDLEAYKDTVSNISDIILRPAKCSQV